MPLNSCFHRERTPSPEPFYRQELGKLSRASRGWCRAACPFHKGKNRTAFSVNVVSGAFHCFNCGVSGGDVIAFVMLRDHLDFKSAAQSLNAWDDTPTSWSEGRRIRKERERSRSAEAAKIALDRQQRIEARDWLHTLERSYLFANRRLAAIGRGSVESFAGETEACWQILSAALPQIRQADIEYRTLAGVEICE